MTFFNRMIMLLGFFLAFSLNAFCQYDDEAANIAEELEQKYDEVDYFNNVFFVKQNGVWEFADEKGNILTNMRMENVECDYYSAKLTIKGKKYTVYDGFENGKVLVGKYGYYAYMDKNGNLTSQFIYDSDGDKTDENGNEVAKLIDLFDRTLDVAEEVNQGKYTSVRQLVTDITPEQAGKMSAEVADSLLVLMCKTFDNSPKSIDMKKAEELFEGAFEPCSLLGCNAVLNYYEKNGLDKNLRLKYVRRLADEYKNAHARLILGNFMAEGKVCPKDVQGAIDYYQLAISGGGDDEYLEAAQDKLAELWKQYGNNYKNPLGKLCSENEKVEIDEDIIVLTNGSQKMVLDTLYQEVLPKGNYEIYGHYEDNFVIGDELSGWQIVKKGGKPLINETFEHVSMINDGEEHQWIVSKDEHWGFYDQDGNPITAMIFDNYASSYWSNPSIEIDGEEYTMYSLFKDGQMILEKDDQFGSINTKGKEVIPFIYDEITRATTGKYIVAVDEKYGVIDKDGKELVPRKYDSIEYDEETGKYCLTLKEYVDL